MDTREPKALRQTRDYIVNAMEGLDSAHTERGEPGIMASLSDDGETNMVAMTAVHCQEHPKETIYNAAAFVYRGARDMEKQLGTAK